MHQAPAFLDRYELCASPRIRKSRRFLRNLGAETTGSRSNENAQKGLPSANSSPTPLQVRFGKVVALEQQVRVHALGQGVYAARSERLPGSE
jgi:hypothetical protein